MFRSHQIFMTVDVKTITVARNIPRFAVLLLIIVSHVSFVKAFFSCDTFPWEQSHLPVLWNESCLPGPPFVVMEAWYSGSTSLKPDTMFPTVHTESD